MTISWKKESLLMVNNNGRKENQSRCLRLLCSIQMRHPRCADVYNKEWVLMSQNTTKYC